MREEWLAILRALRLKGGFVRDTPATPIKIPIYTRFFKYV